MLLEHIGSEGSEDPHCHRQGRKAECLNRPLSAPLSCITPNLGLAVATGFESMPYCDLRDYVARRATRLRQYDLDRSARIAVALSHSDERS
jgi:hypothetical protein